MALKWGELARKNGKWLMPAWLIAAGLVALYFGMVEPRNRYRGIAEQRTTGLAWEPQSLWRRNQAMTASSTGAPEPIQGAGNGLAAGYLQSASMMASDAVPPPAANDSPDRKLVRTDSLDLVVKHPADSADQIRALALRLGGYLETSQVSGDPDSSNASLTIRVPAARFEEARTEIRKLGLRVEDEKVDAQDVTRQYVDQDARLRNLRAEEAQYLGILKRASTVSDTLEVSEKLNEVRGQIEQQQAEFDTLSKQIETVAITVSLRAEVDAQVFGLQWRPLYRLKIAAREGLNGFGDYLAAVTSLAFYLPTILLWLATILIGSALGWRILRWGVRVLFAFPKPAMTEKGAS
jgi:Domain of unknown function (DUF4349)